MMGRFRIKMSVSQEYIGCMLEAKVMVFKSQSNGLLWMKMKVSLG